MGYKINAVKTIILFIYQRRIYWERSQGSNLIHKSLKLNQTNRFGITLSRMQALIHRNCIKEIEEDTRKTSYAHELVGLAL